MQLIARGDWPGSLVLSRGWWRAEARPWNDDVLDAQLRLVRGSRDFLRACTDYLLGRHAPAITSPPLPDAAQLMWTAIGYSPYLALELWQRDLAGRLPAPSHRVAVGSRRDWNKVIDLDRAAFPQLWRIDRAGLAEALGATRRSALLVVRTPGTPIQGFAVVGAGGSFGYLQRIAVDPSQQRGGLGRSLLRASMAWAQRHGGRALMLNTQPDNQPAASLYQAEGFRVLPESLTVLRATQ